MSWRRLRSGLLVSRNDQYPIVAASNANTERSADANYSALLPASISSGDLLLVFVGLSAGAARTISTPSGWNEHYNTVVTGNLRTTCLFHRVADGSEGSSLAITASGNGRFASNSIRITGWTTQYVATPNIESTKTPNPPSLNPGVGTRKFLAIAALVHGYEAVASSIPTGYTTIRNVNIASTTSVGCTTVQRDVEASSEDPSKFTIGGTAEAATTTVLID